MVQRLGVVMNGVTGRMGYRQHLLRSVLAIREQGGVELPDGSRVQLEPLLVGRSEEKLRDIATDLHAHVNLIPYNTVEGLPWKRPSGNRMERFADVLRDARVPVTLRREKGHDIDAACGQLRLKTEQDREKMAAAGA